MPKANVIAVVISDLHLSLTAPACRAETDWLAVQAGYLAQVQCVANEEQVPVLCCGDIFDRWNAPPELITFALEHLPDNMVSIPGQHDLPNHRLDEMKRSGYGVLVEAGKIIDLSTTLPRFHTTDFRVQGFGWGQPLSPPSIADGKLKVALLHQYVWAQGRCYPGAPEEAHVGKLSTEGWDVVFCGDNHKAFHAETGGVTVVNCGGFMRRKSDEIDREPSMWLLRSDGSVSRRRLDVSKDQFHTDPVEKERAEQDVDVSAFVSHLKGLGEQGLDFRAAVKHHLDSEQVRPGVREIMLKALEG